MRSGTIKGVINGMCFYPIPGLGYIQILYRKEQVFTQSSFVQSIKVKCKTFVLG